MKKLIRNSVFETNSSSCHSISIGESDVYDSVIPSDDGVITLHPMDFGWEQKRYNDPYTKMTYLWIYINEWCGKDEEEFMETFQRVVCEHTGASSVIMKPNEGVSAWKRNGYIDHQSVEDNDYHHLFYDDKLLKQFIFDPVSWLETDNDNH
jgi:hypothetical protein